MKLNPWDAEDPRRKYVKAESTDIRKTFRAVRKKQLRMLALQRRKARALAKKAGKKSGAGGRTRAQIPGEIKHGNL